MKSTWQSNLRQAIRALETDTQVQAFLDDLMTEKERQEFARRLQAAKLLDQGVSYVEISEQTGLSSTTIARVAKTMQQGKGYKYVLDHLD